MYGSPNNIKADKPKSKYRNVNVKAKVECYQHTYDARHITTTRGYQAHLIFRWVNNIGQAPTLCLQLSRYLHFNYKLSLVNNTLNSHLVSHQPQCSGGKKLTRSIMREYHLHYGTKVPPVKDHTFILTVCVNATTWITIKPPGKNMKSGITKYRESINQLQAPTSIDNYCDNRVLKAKLHEIDEDEVYSFLP